MSACPPGGHPAGWSQRAFAWAMAHVGAGQDRLVAAHKRALFAHLQGTVLEIGPGTGPNLAYYPPGITLIGVEPNPYMHPYLAREAARLGRTVEMRAGRAEHLPAADGSVDAVVATLVLCSVDQLSLSLQEILRVLRPGGRFLFIEHVAAPPRSRLRRVQHAIRPLWGLLAGGCRPDRETAAALERAGFAQVDYTPFRLPVPVVGPHIVGTATKARQEVAAPATA